MPCKANGHVPVSITRTGDSCSGAEVPRTRRKIYELKAKDWTTCHPGTTSPPVAGVGTGSTGVVWSVGKITRTLRGSSSASPVSTPTWEETEENFVTEKDSVETW